MISENGWARTQVDILTGILCLFVVLTAVPGCSTTQKTEEKDDLEESLSGNFDDSGTDATSNKPGEMSPKQRREIIKSLADLMKKFRSDTPAEWRRIANQLNTFREDMVPDVVRQRVREAQKRGTRGKQARKKLVKWGQLKSTVLQLPSRDLEKWDEVRRKMIKAGPEGRNMFVYHMVQFLGTPSTNRRLAAEQIALCGEEVVSEAWDRMLNLADRARKATKQQKTLPGAMVRLRGLAQVQVHAGQWQRIRRALQHDRVRIRLAMANALTETDDIARASKLLGQVIEQDEVAHVRGAAVNTLGVFDQQKEPIKPLARALRDPNEKIAESAAEALKGFHDHESLVLKALIRALQDLEGKSNARGHRQILYSTLQEVGDTTQVANSPGAWLDWYRNTYTGS